VVAAQQAAPAGPPPSTAQPEPAAPPAPHPSDEPPDPQEAGSLAERLLAKKRGSDRDV
jgi:hypothetical protein